MTRKLIIGAPAKLHSPEDGLPRCFSDPSSYPLANHDSCNRRAQLGSPGTALFLTQCFKLRAELVWPIRKQSLKKPISKREEAGPTRRPFAFNVGPGYQPSLRSLWYSSHLIVNLDISLLRLPLRPLVLFKKKIFPRGTSLLLGQMDPPTLPTRHRERIRTAFPRVPRVRQR